MRSRWFVYIILTKKNKLYTGITTDVARRFLEHKNSKTKKAKFFRADAPQKILYTLEHPNRSTATKIELKIKKMTRKKKLQLIAENLIP